MTPLDFCSLLALIVLPGGFWLGYVFIVNDAKWKMGRDSRHSSDEELKALRAEVKQLGAELHELRDRSSEFDLTLEARLHQLEQRLGTEAVEEIRSRLTGPK